MWAALPAFLLEAAFYLGSIFEETRAWLAQFRPVARAAGRIGRVGGVELGHVVGFTGVPCLRHDLFIQRRPLARTGPRHAVQDSLAE